MQLFSSFNHNDRLFFAKHLSTLLRGGISLGEALRLMAERKDKSIGALAGKILASIENGQALAAALAKYPKEFGAFFCSLVEIGESSGSLEKSLDFLAEKLAREEALRKKVKAMMLYPSIVLSVSAVVGAFVSFFVLPKLAGIFGAFEVELPLATRILLAIAVFVKKYGLFVLVGGAAFFSLVRLVVGIFAPAKLLWHKMKFKIPFVGKVAKSAALSSLFRDLGVMVQSGLPLEYALRVESEVAENIAIREIMRALHRAVSHGSSLGKELAGEKYAFFPALVSRMIFVGENSGKLEDTFFYLADFFEDETDAAAKNGSALLEPVLLLFIGVIAGFVALAVILPIYSLTGSIQR